MSSTRIPFKPSLLFRSTLIAYDELRRRFGVGTTLRILSEVGLRNGKGLPYRDVPSSSDPKEIQTRAELAPAVNLFNVLRERLSEDEAFAVARRIILNSSIVHLRSVYPDIKAGDFRHMAKGDADQTGDWLGDQFAFADTNVVEIAPDRASFDVVHCRIPAALAPVNATRLGSIFCEVDSIYFPIFEPDVDLIRTQTIIRGGSVCDFRLTWRMPV